jgi:putative intracellular protease/amidase
MNVWTIVGIVAAIAAGIAVLGGVVYFGLPRALTRRGLHPHYRGRRFNLLGKRALVITTSHDTLGESGKPTGVASSELTWPYYEFLDANMQVDVASIQGGEIPIDPQTLRWPIAMSSDKRFLADPDMQEKVRNSLKIDDLDFTQYDLVYMAGGWGAAYDLGTSEVLGRKISEAYAAGAVLGSVCHGALGFLKATDENGEPLLEGRHATGVSDKQVRELGISITPQHPETELRKIGAIYECDTARRDFFANLTVVDGRIVTGQNQNAGSETAQKMMGVLVQELAED